MPKAVNRAGKMWKETSRKARAYRKKTGGKALSAQHRKAISEGLKRYHAGKGKKKTTKRRRVKGMTAAKRQKAAAKHHNRRSLWR